MLVVGAIAHMGVDEDIRVPVLKDGCERPGIPGILLDEVAVEVVVAGISPGNHILRDHSGWYEE